MLILNEKDMRKVISWPKVIDSVEEAYRIHRRGEYYMPDRIGVERGKDTVLYMPCFTKEIFGTKFLTLFLDNPKKGYPYLDGLMLLNDLETGKTLSVLDGRYLTAVRTGAVGGVGVRHISREDVRSAGIIGAGQQGFFQAIYAANARDLDHIYLFDSNPNKDWQGYVENLRAEIGQDIAITVSKTVEELVDKSEVIITTTPSETPVLPNDADLLRGKCVIAIGSYKHEMREIPDCIWQLVDNVYIELEFALEETGDLYYPLQQGLFSEDQVRYIGDLVKEKDHPLPLKGETTFFKSVGMGLLDLYVAQKLYEQALEKGIGQQIEF
jgi:ornithine cyclodeaminase/alanine dehydrogenase-like protein (mu-crystallin family)